MAVIFNGGFEAGGFAPWSTPQASNYGYVDTVAVHFGPWTLENTIVGHGLHSGRFDLPVYGAGRTRSQVITGRTAVANTDDYYTLQFFCPVNWAPGTDPDPASGAWWGVSILEVNFQNLGVGGPTVALQAHADHVTLVMQTGVAQLTSPAYQWISNADTPPNPNVNLPPLYAIPAPMQEGVWHELIIHVRNAVDATGHVECWHRIKGQAVWTKTADLAGYPTLQTNPDGTFPTGSLDCIQAYRGPSLAPVTVYLDAFSRSTSLADAQNFLGTPTAITNLTLPVISGLPEVGQNLVCSTGTWGGAPSAYAYQWERETGPATGVYALLPGETGNTYPPVAGDIGRRVSCTVTAS